MIQPTLTEQFVDNGFAVSAHALPDRLLQSLRESTDRLMQSGDSDPKIAQAIDHEPRSADQPLVVQRIRKPHTLDAFFMQLAGDACLLDFLVPLLGPDIRLHHSKINVKAPGVGSPLEWHQDWAFIPHTNPSLAIVSIMIDDCGPTSGPVQFLPGSHRGPLHEHHHDGVFVGAIDPACLELERAVPVTGPAGTVVVHHPMTVHGSGYNLGVHPRRMLFLEFAAADAWPLFYGVDWAEYNARMVCGEPTRSVRLESTTVRMPYPNAREGQGRIYDLQRGFTRRYFLPPTAADATVRS